MRLRVKFWTHSLTPQATGERTLDPQDQNLDTHITHLCLCAMVVGDMSMGEGDISKGPRGTHCPTHSLSSTPEIRGFSRA